MKKVTTNKKKLRKKQQKEQREQINIVFDEFTTEPKLNKFQKKHVMQRCKKCCEDCVNFTPIGEGDHLCIADEPVLILDDYIPTENYFYCKGKKHQTWDELG